MNNAGPGMTPARPEVEVVLATVAVERSRDGRGLVVLVGRVVEVQAIQADAQPVGGLVAQRCRQRAEVILVVRVGARQADQERGTAGVADPGAEALVLEVGTHVVGVLRGAQQVVRAIRPGVRGRAIGATSTPVTLPSALIGVEIW
ncbi:hypothetical protein G6F24_016443 [Rhizopus arrhizus]|nr:hypothetical protein G6F24_016443 [Rhizopus arrhizus]